MMPALGDHERTRVSQFDDNQNYVKEEDSVLATCQWLHSFVYSENAAGYIPTFSKLCPCTREFL